MDTLKHSYTKGTSPLASNPTSRPLRTYLFGGTQISHSSPPRPRSILFESTPSQWTYELRPSTNKEEIMPTVQSIDCIGSSITMPNKVAFMPLMDYLIDEARAVGAVNTCFIRVDPCGRRRYIGTNTDCIGIREALLDGNHSVLLDMCYHPTHTRLVNLAERNDWKTVPGAEVLVRMSVAQQILWLEREPNLSGVQEALSSIQQKSSL